MVELFLVDEPNRHPNRDMAVIPSSEEEMRRRSQDMLPPVDKREDGWSFP